MNLSEIIEKRRSIRRYKQKSISKEIIEDLINHARLAPSAKNRQPWKFVITTEETKNTIADIMIKKQADTANQTKNSVIPTAHVIKQTPVLILVLKPKTDINVKSDILSIGGAIEHICLRATELGLGSLWIRDTVFSQNEITKLIKYEDMELISSIAIGYSDEYPNARPRKKLSEILEWI